MSPLHSFAQRLARALNCLGTPGFPDAMCSAVGELVAAEDISLILFRVGQLPTVEFNTPRESGDTSSLESYVKALAAM